MKGLPDTPTPLKLGAVQKELLRDVYNCERCPDQYGFTRPTSETAYFKFPPTIGAEGQADLLFIGMNPRKTEDNKTLHQQLMSDKSAFAALSLNREGQKAYIARGCNERHYHHHMAIVETLYGKDAKFEDHAAVTELFLCASGDAKKLPGDTTPCAELYFDRVFLKVRPKIVICVWKPVYEYFRSRFHASMDENFLITIQGHSAAVIFLPHPNRHRRR